MDEPNQVSHQFKMNFTEPEKTELRAVLNTPLMQKALQTALSDVLATTYGATTSESAALAYKVAEGARMLVSQLFANVDVKAVQASAHRRFKSEPTIS